MKTKIIAAVAWILISVNAQATGKQTVIEGTIRAYECGDNCYLTVVDSRQNKYEGLCAAPLCQPWNQTARMPDRFIGKRVRVTIEQGNQYDGAGKIRGTVHAFGEIEVLDLGVGTTAPTLGHDLNPVLSPDETFIVFTRSKTKSPHDRCSSGQTADQLRRINVDGTNDELLAVGHAGSSPQEQMCEFSQKQFSSNGSLLFFLSPAWVTSSALHVFDFKTRTVKYIAPANDVIVLNFCTDEHRDQLILAQHRYFAGGGSYDWYWLYDRTGTKEIGPVGDDNETQSSLIRKVQETICSR